MSSNKVVIPLKMDVAEELISKLENVSFVMSAPSGQSHSNYTDAQDTVAFLISKLKYYIKKANSN